MPPHRNTRRDYRIVPIPGRVAALVSGGLDSSVLLVELARKRQQVFPIYVRTGLRWEREELSVLRRFLTAIANKKIMPLTVLQLPMDDLARDAWTVKGRAVPGYRAAVSSNYILGRNLTLLCKAVIFCARNRIGEIAMAPLDANPFPDADPRFFRTFSRTVKTGLGFDLKIVAPYARLTKADVIKRGRDLPLNLTVSCIRPKGIRHCGACTKCAERIEGFKAAGITDLTIYSRQH